MIYNQNRNRKIQGVKALKNNLNKKTALNNIPTLVSYEKT